MAQQSDILDFSPLFKLDVFLNLDIKAYSFYEVGPKKFFAFASDEQFIFMHISAQLNRRVINCDWDFLDNPINCMCFVPSGTWLIIISDQKLLLVPFLPKFRPDDTYDQEWSLSRVTVLPLRNVANPTCVTCWLTKESEKIVIIGCKTGRVIFYSLESSRIVGDCKVQGEITNLQICFDDSLDLLTLLISVSKSQHSKLVLEHRSFGYNWLQQTRAQNDKDKKEGFMSYIKQLSKDKITFFIQGGSKDDNKSQTVEYVLKPTEYLPLFRKDSNNWALTAQYVNGRHFLTAFELNEGTLILESPEAETPTKTFKPHVKNDGLYFQALWTDRLIYLIRKNEVEVHSTIFSGTQSEDRENSELWKAEIIGNVYGAHLVTVKESLPLGEWRVPTCMQDLRVPRFNLEPCLVVTDQGAYLLTTITEGGEWLVRLLARGAASSERTSLALGADLPKLLLATAEMQLSRGKPEHAYYLYDLAQNGLDGWVARLGAFGLVKELAEYKNTNKNESLGDVAVTVKLLALLLHMEPSTEFQGFEQDLKLTILNQVELLELCSFAASIGLWDLVPVFSIQRGYPHILLSALQSRNEMCRGAIACLLKQRCLVPLLLEQNGQWLFDYIVEKRNVLDSYILKCLCLWLNPLQEQLRPLMRDLDQAITSIYTTRLQQLITTFVQIASVIESRHPCPDIHLEITQSAETWRNQFTPKRVLNCGVEHWAVVEDGYAKVMVNNTPVKTELIGRVIDVACGRHHTLFLTENGLYGAGDNSYGQLGVGARWASGAVDVSPGAGAALFAGSLAAPGASVAAGHFHSAAIDVGGRLYMWGWGVHGQLCHGTIDDEWSPKLVTRFQGRKVLSVGCGSCHTVVLMKNGEVWACGAGMHGQIGQGNRNKSSVPVRVLIPDPVVAIAVGNFHNVALTGVGAVWSWGASPQQVRAGGPRLTDSPPDPAPASPTPELHLAPRLVDTTNVRGDIVQISAGMHHSCVLDNAGTMYIWGLNFDGQLGRGDRKHITIPTEVKIPTDSQPNTVKNSGNRTPDVEYKSLKTKALMACGGDFTVYIDDEGRIYITGCTHLHNKSVFMMKKTKRVLKVPSQGTNKFVFQLIDRIDKIFNFVNTQRKPIETRFNPLTCMKDFRKKSWADEIIMVLKPWINEENFTGNLNMAAKFAYHNKLYAQCLRLLLENVKTEPQPDHMFVNHTPIETNEDGSDDTDENSDENKEGQKSVINDVMRKRIEELSMAMLNQKPYPSIDPLAYKELPCRCQELNYCKRKTNSQTTVDIPDCDISNKAAQILDKCISMFPIDKALWEECFRITKDFFLDQNLSVSDFEVVLRKYMEQDPKTMASAIMYSNDCDQYSQILSPKFYLNMSSQVLDTWD